MKKIHKYGIVCGILFINLLYSCNKSKDYIMISTLTPGKDGLVIDELYIDNVIYYRYPDKNMDVYKIKLPDSIIANINRLKSKINFGEIKPEYLNISKQDITVYNVYVQNKKLLKVNFYYGEAPEKFENFIEYLLTLRKLPSQKTYKKINFETRKNLKIVRMPPPPMPNNIMKDDDIDDINLDDIINQTN